MSNISNMSNMDNENTAVPPQQAWSASDVLRLALEDGDFLGFIEVNDSIKTLAHVRQKINEELDHVPKKFNFLNLVTKGYREVPDQGIISAGIPSAFSSIFRFPQE